MLILLDRDGTINIDTGYVGDPNEVTLERDAVLGMALLIKGGATLAVATNQSGIARGLFSRADCDAVNRRLADMLAMNGVEVAGWFVCPHGPDDSCNCRKPRPGLAEQAEEALGLSASGGVVIGDKLSDMDFAAAIGARGILVTTGEGGCHASAAADRGLTVVDSLISAAACLRAL
jgi:D-glycero-D-manno-heptose 1,7-bisphosphate phosphatase